MTITFDYSGADEALRLLTKIQREEKPGPWDWHRLNRTGAYKTLSENRIITKRSVRDYLNGGSERDLRGASLIQGELERLSQASEDLARSLTDKLTPYMPESFAFEHFSLSFALYGGEGEVTDPAVVDLAYSASLGRDALEQFLLRLSLTLLIKRWQGLEKFYLKNFLPIRRYMNFIYTLWEIQIEGLIYLMTRQDKADSDAKRPAALVELDEAFRGAASADKGQLDALGEAFKKSASRVELGIILYGELERRRGRDGVKESLVNPAALFRLLGASEDEADFLCTESLFFTAQLETLLSE